jgi:hypothetical protein
MRLVRNHPSNRGVLEYFDRAVRDGAVRSGAHPDIVQHLEELAAALPVDSRDEVHGRPVLVAPDTGVIFAVPLGTEYGLRLPPAEFALARKAGAEVVHEYHTVGVTLDLTEQFGPHWMFGMFDQREPAWCVAALEFAERD